MTNSKRDSAGDIRAKIERSSLGTRDARLARSRVSDAAADKVVSKAAAYPKAVSNRRSGG